MASQLDSVFVFDAAREHSYHGETSFLWGNTNMQRTRPIILALIIIIALFATVIPAMAGFLDPGTFFNWSFERDNNADNWPDRWNGNGNVTRICGHPQQMFGDCSIVFYPSQQRALIWQKAYADDYPDAFEEGYFVNIAAAAVAAKQLPEDRVYVGQVVHYTGVDDVVIYGATPGGTYGLSETHYATFVGKWAEDLPEVPDAVTWFIYARPGNGYVGFDVVEWHFPFLPV